VGLAPEQALALWAYAQGGVLLVEPPAADGAGFAPPLRRHALAHADRAAAWAFVLYLPSLPNDLPLTREPERAAALNAIAPRLSLDTGRLVDSDLWPALERDDLPAFGEALMTLRRLNGEVLTPLPRTPVDAAALRVMAAAQPAAWGQALTGHGLFALVRGAQGAADLRTALADQLPLGAGRVLVTIADVTGARDAVRTERPLLA
jgi:predicted sugar kinase